jgi:hypothetical protein
LGVMNDIDHGREIIWINLAAKRDLGTVKAIVANGLRRHFPDDDVTVTVDNYSQT